MTCEEFRDPQFTIQAFGTRAGRATLAHHVSRCSDCNVWLQNKLSEIVERVGPDIAAAGLMRAGALYKNDATDPEYREVSGIDRPL